MLRRKARRTVNRHLVAVHHHDWSRDPYSRGAYSYALAGGSNAAASLAPASGRAYQMLFVVQYARRDVAAAFASGDKAMALNKYDMLTVAEYGGRLLMTGAVERDDEQAEEQRLPVRAPAQVVEVAALRERERLPALSELPGEAVCGRPPGGVVNLLFVGSAMRGKRIAATPQLLTCGREAGAQ